MILALALPLQRPIYTIFACKKMRLLQIFCDYLQFLQLFTMDLEPFQLHCQEIGRNILFAFTLQRNLAPQTPLVCYIQIALALRRY